MKTQILSKPHTQKKDIYKYIFFFFCLGKCYAQFSEFVVSYGSTVAAKFSRRPRIVNDAHHK